MAVALLFLATAPAFRNVENIGTILYKRLDHRDHGCLRGPSHDRRRVRPLGGRGGTASGLAAAHTAWYFGLNVWVGVFVALLFSLSIGAFNGWLLHKTGLPSFLVTLGTFFVLQNSSSP